MTKFSFPVKVKSNKVSDIRQFYLSDLKNLYPEEECASMIDILLEDLLGITRITRHTNPLLRLSESELLKFHFAVKELKTFRPVQHITGKAHFYGLTLNVNKDVLIPRPETEELVELILEENDRDGSPTIVDIGTGSGAIAIAMKHHLKSARVTACDVSTAALEVARRNASAFQADIRFIECDIFRESDVNLLPFADIIVSNPPYVTDSDKTLMHKNVLQHDPAGALFVQDEDPLVFYRHILGISQRLLKKEGRVYFEINERFGAEITTLMKEYGFGDILLKQDIRGRDRIVRGIFSGRKQKA